MAAADIGLPQLAMHSAYETAGVQDMEYLVRLAKAFYNI
jgi:aspartyl aminopeptidase